MNKNHKKIEGVPKEEDNHQFRYGIDECVDLATTLENSVQHVAYSIRQITEPKSMEEALKNDHAKEWKIAADQEYHSLMENDTWELTKLPEGRKPIGSKWVFKVKYRSDGTVVVRFSSIRALLAFAVQNDMLIHQMDVVTAFLNGKLDEEIYMHQPDGYVVQGKEHLVCRLKKSLYGLKQSPRCWNTVFQQYMESIGFEQSPADSCVYFQYGDCCGIC